MTLRIYIWWTTLPYTTRVSLKWGGAIATLTLVGLAMQ